MDEEDAYPDEEEAVEVILEPCQTCGRKFNPKTLIKHQKICNKVTNKKRKVFDSTKQRAEALEMSVQEVKKAVQKQTSVPKVNWRAQHKDFLDSIRNAKKVTQAIAEGKPLPPPPAALINPNYIQCEWCERRFNPSAADRHIQFCKEQHSRIKRQGGGNKPVSKAKPKPAYEPPKPKVRTESSSAPPPPRPNHNANAAAAPPPPSRAQSGSLQERSGLRRPGFTSRLPSAPSNHSIQPTRKLGKDTQKQGYDEPDTTASNGVSYTGGGPALRTGRGGKSYPDVKAVNGQNRIVGGLGRGNGTLANKALPNSLNKNSANRMGKNGTSENGLPPFCHSCDTKYPVVAAKFCCECGMKRLIVR